MSERLCKKPRYVNSILESYLNQVKHKDSVMKQKLMNMVYFAFINFEFYKKKFQGELSENFNIKQLPMTTRDELRGTFQDFIKNYPEEDYSICRTSSTGKDAFLFAKPSKHVDFPRMAVSFLNSGLWRIGDPWLKLTTSSCINTGCVPKSTPDEISDSTIIATNFLNEGKKEIKKRYDFFKNSKSRLIHANPNYLKLLLFMFKKYNLKLDKTYAINSTYEPLLQTTRKLIKKYLKCEVFNQYGCSEIGPITFTCKHGNNHIFTDAVYVEVVPDKKFGRGDIGRVIVTDLRNDVMPFVRYHTGDLAYIIDKKRCTCGLATPIMGNIMGREEDLIYYNGKAIPSLEVDPIFYNADNILMYQVIFEEKKFTIKLLLEDKSKGYDQKKIKEMFRKMFADSEMEIEIVDIIFPYKGGELCRGKYRTVVVK